MLTKRQTLTSLTHKETRGRQSGARGRLRSSGETRPKDAAPRRRQARRFALTGCARCMLGWKSISAGLHLRASGSEPTLGRGNASSVHRVHDGEPVSQSSL